MKKSIIKALKKIEKQYYNGELELCETIEECYSSVVKVSQGYAFVFAESDVDTPNLFYDDILHRLGEDLKGKTVTIKDFFVVKVCGIDLHILVTKEKDVLK